MRGGRGVIPTFTPILVTDVSFAAAAGTFSPGTFGGTVITMGQLIILTISMLNFAPSQNTTQLFMTLPFGIVPDATNFPVGNIPTVCQSSSTAGEFAIAALLTGSGGGGPNTPRIRFTRANNGNWLSSETLNFSLQVPFKKA